MKDAAVVLALLLSSSSLLLGSGHSRCSDSLQVVSPAHAPHLPPPQPRAGLTDPPVLNISLAAHSASLTSVSGQCTALRRAAQSSWGHLEAVVAKKQLRHELSASFPLESISSLPVFGVGTLYVLALFQMCLQVHFQQRWAAGVIGAANRPVITAAFMISAHGERQKEGKISDKQKLMETTEIIRKGANQPCEAVR